MNISKVHTKGYYSYLHQAIYGAVDSDRYIRRHLRDTNSFINEQIAMRTTNEFMMIMARRVALMRLQQYSFLKHLDELDDLSEDIRSKLPVLKSCTPEGVFFEEEVAPRYCRKYAVCPWCRFRKALEIAEALEEHRERAKQLAFITIVTPTHFLPPPEESVEDSFSDFRHDYSKLIKIICKKKELFFADYVVTVPNWRATMEGDDTSEDMPRRFSFNLETTIIGLMEEKAELPLPENCVSPEFRSRLIFGGIGPGTWSVHKPTKRMMAHALRCAMGFSPALFSKHLNLEEYGVALNLQSMLRSVGHGAAQSR